jgi:arylamine N-acetyltransferase
MGFGCFPVMADMRHGRNIHCALLVEDSDGTRYLADPGYLVPVPVRILPGREASLTIRGQRLVWKPSSGDSYDLYTSDGGNTAWRYRVRTTPVCRGEFIRHWQSSFDDTGMNSLHANLRSDTQRISAHNMNLRRTDGLSSSNEKLRGRYSECMHQNFGISRAIALEAEAEWRRACLAR